ncbi:MAG: cupin domain-containing protein [Alcaligenaceae bacterium]|nr:cupin domain-containing protein [Alcaligenaceae bacterium]
MSIPVINYSREEMRKRVALFKDLKGFDGGLPDSDYPSAKRKLYNVIGFQPPEKDSESETSPLGDDAAENAAIKISEGFNMGFVEAAPGKGPMMHNHDTNETFMPITGRWRCCWETDGKVESFELGPQDTISFPAHVNRRFENITEGEPDATHWLLVIVSGNVPKAEFSEGSMTELRAQGYVD